MRTSGSTESITQLEESVVGVDGDNKAQRDRSKFDGNKFDKNKLDRSKLNRNEGDNEIGKKGQNLFKTQNLSKSKKIEMGFFISGARIAFTKLRQAFIKAPILHQFNLERHIQIETDILGYTIGVLFSQLTSDDFGR